MLTEPPQIRPLALQVTPPCTCEGIARSPYFVQRQAVKKLFLSKGRIRYVLSATKNKDVNMEVITRPGDGLFGSQIMEPRDYVWPAPATPEEVEEFRQQALAD
jgi:hypothetical protein